MMKSKCSEIKIYRLKNWDKRYLIEVEHEGLNKHQVVRSDSAHLVQSKANAIMAQWDEMWTRRVEKQERSAAIEHGKETAARITADAEEALQQLDSILARTLTVDDTVDWESLKETQPFPKPEPQFPSPIPKPSLFVIPKPSYPELPKKPEETDSSYQVELTFLDRSIASRRKKKELAARKQFEADLEKWRCYKANADAEYAVVLEHWEEEKAETELEYAEDLTRWQEKANNVSDKYAEEKENWKRARDDYLKARDSTYLAIEEQKLNYMVGEDPQAILDYCDIVLSNSRYPDYFPQSYELDYNPDSKLIVADYQLPPLDSIPTLKSVRYIQSRDEYTEKHISKTDLRRIYDNLLYQIALRTIHELFEADAIDAIATIVFNGYVESIDPATGQEKNACILSLSANKDTFEKINLANIEPKACFKQLKGISASRLDSLTPVAPIMKIDREDSRFISSYDVADEIEGENLAAMDWADFEHLIRELFEKEFATSGGEVKVTQASRDGGIDAVAFDPDPIRGGKIVIQAKRYTNTVGVSAVRDLYGTVINEGASKGILVTTADYGPDAHEFAVGKPIVLLNGSQLLYLLEQHGHHARIDLKEAKQIIADKG